MTDSDDKIPVHKAVEKPVNKTCTPVDEMRLHQLFNELYPPLSADAAELTEGLDEADGTTEQSTD